MNALSFAAPNRITTRKRIKKSSLVRIILIAVTIKHNIYGVYIVPNSRQYMTVHSIIVTVVIVVVLVGVNEGVYVYYVWTIVPIQKSTELHTGKHPR